MVRAAEVGMVMGAGQDGSYLLLVFGLFGAPWALLFGHSGLLPLLGYEVKEPNRGDINEISNDELVFNMLASSFLLFMLLDDVVMIGAAFKNGFCKTASVVICLTTFVIFANQTASIWTFQSRGSYFEAILNLLTFFIVLELDHKVARLLKKDLDVPVDDYESLSDTQEMGSP